MVDHGERHILNIMDLLTKFLASQPRLFEDLNDMEKFCLIFSILLHDIGGEDLPERNKIFLYFKYALDEHPWVGEEIFRKIAPSLGFSKEEIEIIAELIPEHSSKVDIDGLPETREIKGQKVRMRLLAAILRFVDACDIQ